MKLLLLALLALVKAATHGDSFTPDINLHVTAEERKQSCVPTKEIIVINGTSPGPELRLPEGKLVWIRVYNDMLHENLTMVSSPTKVILI